MASDEYQGWSNYETWNVKLWIDNEQPSYEHWRDVTRQLVRRHGDDAKEKLAEQLESEHTDNEMGVEMPNGVYGDLLTHALGRVNWHEIAETMISDEEEG